MDIHTKILKVPSLLAVLIHLWFVYFPLDISRSSSQKIFVFRRCCALSLNSQREQQSSICTARRSMFSRAFWIWWWLRPQSASCTPSSTCGRRRHQPTKTNISVRKRLATIFAVETINPTPLNTMQRRDYDNSNACVAPFLSVVFVHREIEEPTGPLRRGRGQQGRGAH